MSSRTFILRIGKESIDLVESEDIVNVIAIRALEVYMEVNSVEKVDFDIISCVRKFAKNNIKTDKDRLNYYIDIDFEKDIVLK